MPELKFTSCFYTSIPSIPKTKNINAGVLGLLLDPHLSAFAIGFRGESGRLSGLFCRRQGWRLSENRSAQSGSGISILGVMGILRRPGILGWKTVRQGV